MYLISYGTRPELIKLFPLINKFKELGIKHKTLFTGQHKDLILEFENLTHKPDFTLKNTMTHGQTINQLISKIVKKSDEIINKLDCEVIVQGDAASSFAIALSGFNNGRKIIHLEAGLRTNDLESPYPEEGYRNMISKISNVHLCPTKISVENLINEGVTKNVFLVGNTIVDSCNSIVNQGNTNEFLIDIVNKNKDYFICTIHRRENIKNFNFLWKQINEISKSKKIIYVRHPSVPSAKKYLSNQIIQLNPLNYQDMIYLINNSNGLISDSGGLQEEAICLNKKILICRNTTERPETVDSGYGKLIGNNILGNINFLEKTYKKHIKHNPYGNDVVNKIVSVLNDNIYL